MNGGTTAMDDGLVADLDVTVGAFRLRAALDVAPGEVLAVLGPNGSGKSTLLAAVAGLVPVGAGHVRIGTTVLDDTTTGIRVPPEQRPVGFVFQQYLLFDHLSVLDNVAFGPRARGASRRESRRIAEPWLERFGLADRRDDRPGRLSGGQAQRVALARALAIEPRVLLLDEPLAALDATSRRQVRRDLRHDLAAFDGVRILVTHDPVDAYALADRIAVLDAGSVAQTGTVAEITAHPRSRFVAEMVGTNLIVGRLDRDGLTTDEGIRISVVADFTGPAFATVRPQSIAVSRVVPDTSARNTVTGTVDGIDQLGDRVRIGIAGPVHLTAEITRSALETLALRPGDTVHAAIKATDIETYPA